MYETCGFLYETTMMFCLIPETRQKTPQPVSGSMLSHQFFQMLPTEFQKNLAVAQAATLGVSVKTLDYWLGIWVQQTKLQRIAHGNYRKSA